MFYCICVFHQIRITLTSFRLEQNLECVFYLHCPNKQKNKFCQVLVMNLLHHMMNIYKYHFYHQFVIMSCLSSIIRAMNSPLPSYYKDIYEKQLFWSVWWYTFVMEVQYWQWILINYLLASNDSSRRVFITTLVGVS